MVPYSVFTATERQDNGLLGRGLRCLSEVVASHLRSIATTNEIEVFHMPRLDRFDHFVSDAKYDAVMESNG